MVAPAFKETSNVIPLLPAPDPNDSDDVVVALQTARALQRKGDLREALRWLRRAADAASEARATTGVLSLSPGAAADLTNLLGAPDKSDAPSSLPPSLPPLLLAPAAPSLECAARRQDVGRADVLFVAAPPAQGGDPAAFARPSQARCRSVGLAPAPVEAPDAPRLRSTSATDLSADAPPSDPTREEAARST